MDVIINDVVASVRMVDRQSLLDQHTLATIVRSVMSAIDEREVRSRRRADETRIDDDGRGGLRNAAGGH